MAERTLIVDHLKFSYEGLFNVEELHYLIQKWFLEKGWNKLEKMNEEQITPEGKQIMIIIQPWKNLSDYYKIVMKIKMIYTNIKDVDVEHDKKQLRLNQGLVRMTFDAYVVSDRKHQWTKKPFFWFLSIAFEKYFFRQHFEKAQRWLESDVEDLHEQIKTYCNTFKYNYQ